MRDVRGFSLLELLIALAIASTALIAVTLVTFGIPEVLMHARIHREALSLAEDGLFKEMARGPRGFPHTLSSATTTHGAYERVLTASMLGDGSAKQVATNVSWHGRTKRKDTVLSGVVTDYAHASEYACSPFLLEEADASFAGFTELDSTLPAITALAADRTHIVAAASSVQGFNDPSLFVFVADRATGIRLAGTYDHAAATKTGYLAIALGQGYLYALSAHTCTGAASCASLDIFSLSSSPLVRVGTLSLPQGRSIAYRDARLYVGLRANAQVPELLVFDVSSPQAPVRIGSAEIGSTINDIEVDASFAYLATSDNSAAGNKAVMAFDVTMLAEGMLPDKRTRQSGAGVSQHLTRSGDTLYLGRSSPLNSRELYALRTADLSELSSEDTDSSVAGLVALGQEVFVLTRTRLTRHDLSSPNASEPEHHAYPLPDGTEGTALACGGGRLYLALTENSGGRLMRLGL